MTLVSYVYLPRTLLSNKNPVRFAGDSSAMEKKALMEEVKKTGRSKREH